jgi:uncharacterized protein YecT (DUF1311 family)
MTIFRSSLVLALTAVAPAAAAGGTGADVARATAEQSCQNIDPRVGRKCSAKRIASKELKLKSLYPRALDAVARDFELYGKFDNRTDPAFLERSQSAWERFIEDDCTVKAASGGGSNNSISDRYSACYEAELDHRIKFLEQLANGSYRTG